VEHPRALGLTCVLQGKTVPIAECPADSHVRALVSGGSKGSLSLANPTLAKWIDTDPTVPGFTPFPLQGGLPGPLVVDAAAGKAYLVLGVTRKLARLSLANLDAGKLVFEAQVDLAVDASTSFDAAAIALTTDPEPRLYLADAAGGRLWTLPIAQFAAGAKLIPVDIGGSPNALAYVQATGDLYVGHLRHGHVTVYQPKTAAVLTRISIAPACQDGLDNDQDGKTDRDDRGCDDPRDRSEADPEQGEGPCNDGQDNDADGQIDAQDPGCAATPTGADACRNGLDDDGDGKADFPADPGCIGFGDASEWSDAAGCQDGQDNNGDGLVDGADPLCAGNPSGTERLDVPGAEVAACQDKKDNDGDGLTDFPADPDCADPRSAGEVRGACADAKDDDGDGLTDLADPDCYNRATPGEVVSPYEPAMVLAATFRGQWLVVADRSRRVLSVLDTKTRSLVVPVAGQAQPFARASLLDARDGIVGLSLPQLPQTLAPVRQSSRNAEVKADPLGQGQDAMAVGLSMGGLVFLQFEALRTSTVQAPGTPAIGLLTIDADVAAKDKVRTSAAKPVLQIGGEQVDLGLTVPARYAKPVVFGISDTDPDLRNYSGLGISRDSIEHRTEAWRFAFEGLLPGTERTTGRFVRADLLHDATADFCRLGVLEGDLLLVERGGAACGGQEPGVVQYRVAKVHADSLELDPQSGRRDVPVTLVNQAAYVPGTLAGLPEPGCFAEGGVRYEIRASGWLVTGSRTGLLSSRDALGGACRALLPVEGSGGRLREPKLKAGAAVASCPLAAKTLDPAFEVPAFQHPVFQTSILPGCVAEKNADGLSVPRLLPSMRNATWLTGISSAFQPRTSAVGAAPIAAGSGPTLRRIYVIDQGTGSLQSVDIESGKVVDSLE